MPLDTQRERLEALRDQECVERRDRRADVAQQLHACLDDVGEVADRFGVDDAVVARVGSGQPRELVGVRGPVEPATIDDDAGDRRP